MSPSLLRTILLPLISITVAPFSAALPPRSVSTASLRLNTLLLAGSSTVAPTVFSDIDNAVFTVTPRHTAPGIHASNFYSIGSRVDIPALYNSGPAISSRQGISSIGVFLL
ncbi:hypothetical protein ABR759_18595 [Escherichia coli]